MNPARRRLGPEPPFDLVEGHRALAGGHRDAAARLASSARRWRTADAVRAALDVRGEQIERLAAELSQDRARHAQAARAESGGGGEPAAPVDATRALDVSGERRTGPVTAVPPSLARVHAACSLPRVPFADHRAPADPPPPHASG